MNKKKFLKFTLILLPVLILALLFSAWYLFHSKFSVVYEENSLAPSEIPDKSYEEIVSPTEEEIEEMESAVADLEEKETVEATGDIKEDGDVLNILLIGTDERSNAYSENARGDSCILLSINTMGDVPQISLVSFERGIGVPILEGEYAGQYDWLTHTFRYGGAELLTREVRECFKVDVDHYIRINFNAFTQGINAIGGVDVHFDAEEANLFRTEHGLESAKEGTNHLDGEMALNYVRLRKIDSDWVRIQRQREVIISAINSCRNLSLSELNALIDTVLPLVKTNIPESMLPRLLLLLPRLQELSIQQTTIPQPNTYGGMRGMGGRSLFAVDFDTNARFLQEYLYTPATTE